MVENVKQSENTKKFIKTALVIGAFSLLASIAKNLYSDYKIRSQDAVACIPENIQGNIPFVYTQGASHPVPSDAQLKSFIEEYIYLRYNEIQEDYVPATMHERYQNAKISSTKQKLADMSLGVEKQRNIMIFGNSSEIYKELISKNYGWVFDIDDILVGPNGIGTSIAIIRGKFSPVTPPNVSNEMALPAGLLGYREITLEIMQGMPIFTRQGDLINKFGLFITKSKMEILSLEQRTKVQSRDMNFYIEKAKE